MGLRPLSDRVVVKAQDRATRTASGLYLPVGEKPQEGTVVAVGPGRVLEDGSRAEHGLSVGDHVVYAKHAGLEFDHEGVDYLIFVAGDLLAVVA